VCVCVRECVTHSCVNHDSFMSVLVIFECVAVTLMCVASMANDSAAHSYTIVSMYLL